MTKILKSITFLSLFMFSSILFAQPYGYSNTRGSSGGGANVNLSNLSSVAVNESIIPGADNTIDLGSLTKRWKTVYAGTSYVLHNNNLDTLTIDSPGASSFKIYTDLTVDLTVEAGSDLNLNSRPTVGAVRISGGQGIINSDSDIQLNPSLGYDVSIGLDGTALLPSLTFGTTDDPNTGLFHPAADTIGISTAGSERLRIISTGELQPGSDGSQQFGTTALRWNAVNSISLYARGDNTNTSYVQMFDDPGGGSLITSTNANIFDITAPNAIFLNIIGSAGGVTSLMGDTVQIGSVAASGAVITMTGKIDITPSGFSGVPTIEIFNDGSASSPTIVLGTVSDQNTGIFHPAADTLAISNAGTETLRFTSDNALEVNASTAAVSALGKGRIRYLAASNALQVSNNGGAYANIVNGSLVSGRVTLSTGTSSIGDDADLTFNGTVLAINQDGTAALPSLTMGTSADADTGIYHPAANELAITAGGSQRILFRLSSAVNGTPRISIPIGTLTGDGEWGIYETGTFLNGATNNAYFFRVDGTGAGTAAGQQHSGLFNMLPGYTGTARNSGVWGNNSTAQASPSVGDLNNINAAIGVFGRSAGASAGYNFGVAGSAEGSSGSTFANALYVGVYARAKATIVSGTSIGVFARGGHGGSGTTRIGGYFSNDPDSSPTFVNGALIADSPYSGEPIFLGRNGGTTRFTIADTGITTLSIDGSASAPALTFGATSDPNTGIWHPSADILAFSTSGSEAMRFQTTGNASFGTTSDLAQLAIDNGSTAESILIARDNGTAVFSIIDGGDVGLGVTPTEKLSIKDHSAFSGSESQTTTGAVQTTDATQTNVIIITLNDTSVYWFEADVVGRRTDVVGDRVHYKFSGLCYREGGGAVIEAQTNMITQESAGATAFDAAFTASGNAIRVSVQGESAKTVNWSTTLTYQRVSGNG